MSTKSAKPKPSPKTPTTSKSQEKQTESTPHRPSQRSWSKKEEKQTSQPSETHCLMSPFGTAGRLNSLLWAISSRKMDGRGISVLSPVLLVTGRSLRLVMLGRVVPGLRLTLESRQHWRHATTLRPVFDSTNLLRWLQGRARCMKET